MTSVYDETYARSIHDPEGFWGEAAEAIHWYKRWDRVLDAGVARDHDEIIAEVVRMVRERIGPVAAFKTAVVVARLPKTRSGKILRGAMAKIADGEDYRMPATIDDPAILDEIDQALKEIGYAA